MFAAEFVLFVANLRSLLKLCCLQQIYVHCQSCVVYSGSVIRCRNRVASNELAFATEIMVPAAKQFSLPNCAADNEPIFAIEVCGL